MLFSLSSPPFVCSLSQFHKNSKNSKRIQTKQRYRASYDFSALGINEVILNKALKLIKFKMYLKNLKCNILKCYSISCLRRMKSYLYIKRIYKICSEIENKTRRDEIFWSDKSDILLLQLFKVHFHTLQTKHALFLIF